MRTEFSGGKRTKIGGKLYQSVGGYSSKRNAKVLAQELRSKGKVARVLFSEGHWAVFSR